MTVAQAIEQALTDALEPLHIEVIDESHLHSVPEGAESHFKVTLVSDRFQSETLVKRHQAVYKLLSKWLASGVHALALHTYTAEEWSSKGKAPASPDCKGGSRLDAASHRSS